ncbi:MAG: hypothetical protein H7282_05535 [Cytophagaceae bacterium]|nr:hypothetical protein [Cytophagaceae bacterium]
MDDLLDYSPPTNKNFKKAKILFKITAVAFIMAIACTFSARFLPRNNDVRDHFIALPSLLFIILAPIALFYILKSYIKK